MLNINVNLKKMQKKELIDFLEWFKLNLESVIVSNKTTNQIADEYLETIKPKEQDVSVAFEEFWKPMFGKKWTGSKADACNKFNKACKEVYAGDLLIAKTDYFSYLSVCSYDRPIMAASVFLNTATKRWTEDWKEYATQELKKQGKAIVVNTAEVKKITNVNDLFS